MADAVKVDYTITVPDGAEGGYEAIAEAARGKLAAVSKGELGTAFSNKIADYTVEVTSSEVGSLETVQPDDDGDGDDEKDVSFAAQHGAKNVLVVVAVGIARTWAAWHD